MEFEDYSWHDNSIHGFKIIESEDGTGILELDIDYITEWLRSSDGIFNFKIAPATLTFENITDLEVALDYKSCSAGITPPIIHTISRQPIQYPNGYKSFVWHIEINWPKKSHLKFNAPSFNQQLRKEPIIQDDQILPKNMRT